jgi:aryl-alcohol dehydrogenase-like predicted oxidoreductase
VEQLKNLVPAGSTLAAFALRWILMDAGVTCAIPGAKRADQVKDNIAAADLAPVTEQQMAACRSIYDRYIRTYIHARW